MKIIAAAAFDSAAWGDDFDDDVWALFGYIEEKQ